MFVCVGYIYPHLLYSKLKLKKKLFINLFSRTLKVLCVHINIKYF